MKNILLACICVLVLVGCHQDSEKVRKQKEIYLSLSDVPRRELELEISRVMEKQHLATPGKAMIYLLDTIIDDLPKLNSMIDKTAADSGIQVPPKDPLEEAEDRNKTARVIQAMRQAREGIAEIESDASQ